MGARDRCCCEVDCVIFTTDFSPCPGESGPPAAADWEEITGTWTVYDPNPPDCYDAYMSAGAAGDKILCLHPTNSREQCVTVSIDGAAGSRARILVGATANLSSYLYVENDPDTPALIFGNEGGVIRSFTGPGLTSQSELIVFVSGPDGSNKVTLSAGQQGRCEEADGAWICTDRPSGNYVGLMDGGGAARAKFMALPTSFQIRNHTDTPNAPEPCCECDCRCDESCVPRDLLYWRLTRIELGSEECCTTCSEGLAGYDAVNEIHCTWNISIALGCSGLELAGNLVKNATPRNTPYSGWILQDTSGFTSLDNPEAAFPGSTCDPLYLYWEFSAEYPPDQGPCNFILEVTDDPLTCV
jgi:hypothetical protein